MGGSAVNREMVQLAIWGVLEPWGIPKSPVTFQY